MTAISKSLRDGSDRVAVLFDRFARDEAGSTAIEYTMMVGFISFAIITSLTAIGRVIDEDVFSVIVAAAAAM
ncbi:Flp family type IVb pilin [Stappia stellulata]|uniref:Flp family type IVb pilin n=1 Tax=Stappia TaxID=152161 RepID=UPI001CD3E485|nr:Flp family type IVb pilin [Stappia stellulata]MCA1244136.1 Flp family type IVb pilin [Stappia stellulata]